MRPAKVIEQEIQERVFQLGAHDINTRQQKAQMIAYIDQLGIELQQAQSVEREAKLAERIAELENNNKASEAANDQG